jgi:signal transduction histidine kinase
MSEVQRRIGVLFAAVGGAVTSVNVLTVVALHNLSGLEILLRPTVGPVAALIALLVGFSFIDTDWARGGQVVMTYAFAAPAFLDDWDAFFGLGFVVMGTVSAFSYGWFRKRPWIKGSAVLGYTTLFMIYGAYAEQPSEVTVALNGIIFLSLVLTFLWIVYSKDIREYIESAREARDELDANQSWIEHGRNAGHIAHNFKGKLAVIDGYLQMLYFDAGEADKANIEVARRAVSELDKMTRLMVFAGKARRQREIEPVPLCMILESILQQYSVDKEHSRRARLVLSGCPDIRLRASPADLMQLFDNVIRNAFEAIESEGRISVVVRQTTDGVEVEIEDNGVGIRTCAGCEEDDSDECDCTSCSVFQEGRTTKPQGSGFGMVYVQRTLRKYRATLQIRSRIGVGTRMTMWFPQKAIEYGESIHSRRRRGTLKADGPVSSN